MSVCICVCVHVCMCVCVCVRERSQIKIRSYVNFVVFIKKWMEQKVETAKKQQIEEKKERDGKFM